MIQGSQRVNCVSFLTRVKTPCVHQPFEKLCFCSSNGEKHVSILPHKILYLVAHKKMPNETHPWFLLYVVVFCNISKTDVCHKISHLVFTAWARADIITPHFPFHYKMSPSQPTGTRCIFIHFFCLLWAAELQNSANYRTRGAGALASLPIIFSVDNTKSCQISLLASPNNWQGVEG